jgi:hypothetical protein
VTGLDPWATIRAAVHHHTAGSSISARAAFAAATRGGWRACGAGDGPMGSLVPGAPASYAVWDVGELSELEAGALPVPATADSLPRCRQTVHRGAVIHG